MVRVWKATKKRRMMMIEGHPFLGMRLNQPLRGGGTERDTRRTPEGHPQGTNMAPEGHPHGTYKAPERHPQTPETHPKVTNEGVKREQT